MEADPGSGAESQAAGADVVDSFSQLWSDVMGMLVSVLACFDFLPYWIGGGGRNRTGQDRKAAIVLKLL